MSSSSGKSTTQSSPLLPFPFPLSFSLTTQSTSRITTPNHQAQTIFLEDVNTTTARIKSRAAELLARPSSPPATEQIQLHAVDPTTKIHINIPQAGSAEPVEQAAREVFERFPPGLQRALESGELDRVNAVLGKMSVEEAEEVVAQLGEGGMLSLEEGVIDGGTEEGRERLRALEKEAREGKEGDEEGQRFAEEDGEEGDEIVEENRAGKAVKGDKGKEIQVADPD